MKRTIFFLYFSVFALLTAFSGTISRNKAYQDYFNTYKDIAISQMHEYGIPASITLAQGVLESGAGMSELARRSNNHFGIKCSNGWSGRRVYHDDDIRNDCFRAYNNVSESYLDHALFLKNSQRYASLFKLKPTDYKGWAKGLKACGYATSPTYAHRLIEIIELYELDQYDKGTGWSVRHGGSSSWNQSSQRQIIEFNHNYYVVAREGDTFRSIANDVHVSYRHLAKFNERDKDAVLEAGEYVWLKKKRRKAPKEYKGYVYRVAAGESMYSIAQRFGIRVKYLYKMNDLQPDYVIRVGDPLRLR
jgi:LysM repeat protein